MQLPLHGAGTQSHGKDFIQDVGFHSCIAPSKHFSCNVKLWLSYFSATCSGVGYLPSHLLSTYGQTRRKDMSRSFPYRSPFIHFFKLGFRAREHFLAPVQGPFRPRPPARPPSAISIAGHIVYDVSGADYIWQADQ